MPDLIAYHEIGKGKPLVLLHGFCETYEIWNKIAGPLSENYRVIMPDLPGFGKSPLPKEELSIESVAKKISEWLKATVDEPVTLMGHSLGGYITLAFAKNYPEQLNAFGLIHSTSLADSPEKKENRLKAAEFVRKNGSEPFIRTLIPSLFNKHKIDKTQPLINEVMNIAITTPSETIAIYSLAMRERPDRSKMISQQNIPVFFLAGQYDEVIPFASSKDQIKNIKNGNGSILTQSAHMGMMEEPERTVKEIINFMDSV